MMHIVTMLPLTCVSKAALSMGGVITGMPLPAAGMPAAPAPLVAFPVLAVGRSTGRAAAVAGFRCHHRDRRRGRSCAAHYIQGDHLLWPAAVAAARDRSFDMVAALAPVANVRMAEVYAMMSAPGLADAALTAIADGDVLGVVLMAA